MKFELQTNGIVICQCKLLSVQKDTRKMYLQYPEMTKIKLYMFFMYYMRRKQLKG